MASKVLTTLQKFNEFAICDKPFLIKIDGKVFEARPNPKPDAINIGMFVVFMQGRLKDIGRVKAFAWLSNRTFIVSIDTIPNHHANPHDVFTITNMPMAKITHVLSYYTPPVVQPPALIGVDDDI